jgi:hypothetical protein
MCERFCRLPKDVNEISSCRLSFDRYPLYGNILQIVSLT